MKSCKKCLLLQAGEVDVYTTVKDYLDSLDSSLKVDEEEYIYRLRFCNDCDSLISGMCVKCGCYAEIRAALKGKSCPDADNERWK